MTDAEQIKALEKRLDKLERNNLELLAVLADAVGSSQDQLRAIDAMTAAFLAVIDGQDGAVTRMQ